MVCRIANGSCDVHDDDAAPNAAECHHVAKLRFEFRVGRRVRSVNPESTFFDSEGTVERIHLDPSGSATVYVRLVVGHTVGYIATLPFGSTELEAIK